MAKGIVRLIDGAGRVVIPKEIRRTLGLEDYDPVDIYTNGTTICMEKACLRCVCCGTSETDTELKDYKGVLMCPECHPDTAKENGGVK